MSTKDCWNCEETVRRLDDYLDRELSEPEMALVREHLNECDVCANGVKFDDTVCDAIRAKLQQTSLPDGLKQRVFARLRQMEDRNA